MATAENTKGDPMPTVTKMAVKIADAPQISGERLLTVQETAAIIGAAVGTLNRARIHGGNFPAYVKRGKSVRYKLSTVIKWMADQEEHQTTSEMDAKKREHCA